MLSLTRKVGESIILETEHGPIEIVVKEIRRNQVRIGTVAPKSVPIWREELYKERQADEAAAE